MREKNPFQAEKTINRQEVKNAAGEKICDIQLEYSLEDPELPFGLKGRELTEIHLEKETTEGVKKIDLLSQLQKNLPKGLKIIETDSEGQGSYSLEYNIAVVPRPSTALNLGILLHELGHASQGMEEQYRNMLEVKNRANSTTLLWNDDWLECLEKIKPIFTEKEWREIQGFQKKLAPLMQEKQEVSGQMQILNQKADRIKKEMSLGLGDRLKTSTQLPALTEIYKRYFLAKDDEERKLLDQEVKDFEIKNNILLVAGEKADGKGIYESLHMLLEQLTDWRRCARVDGNDLVLTVSNIFVQLPYNESLEMVKRYSKVEGDLDELIGRVLEIDSELDEITAGRFNDLVDKSIKTTERDATRRAFEWMRSLKKEGFDFLGTMRNPEEMPDSTKECKDVILKGDVDAYKGLKHALGTYRASKLAKR